jgi:hypothetical protein
VSVNDQHMNLQITARMRVKDLKRQFSDLFPFLKIEIFRLPHQTGQGSGMDNKVHDKLFLSEATGKVKEGTVELSPALTVAAFENIMQKTYGLPVQVFRKSGELWLQTMHTDALSLEKQNQMGREASSTFKSSFNANTLFL